jgi:hypothetical protein
MFMLSTVSSFALDGTNVTELSSLGAMKGSYLTFMSTSWNCLVLEQVHGIINAVSWGLLLPLGVMAARYLRRFSGANPWWFYIHVTCQCLGYLLGVVGWALGIKLENYNKSTVHYKHRNLGIAIFTLATLQVWICSCPSFSPWVLCLPQTSGLAKLRIAFMTTKIEQTSQSITSRNRRVDRFCINLLDYDCSFCSLV